MPEHAGVDFSFLDSMFVMLTQDQRETHRDDSVQHQPSRKRRFISPWQRFKPRRYPFDSK
jgi:hypothetical protein